MIKALIDHRTLTAINLLNKNVSNKTQQCMKLMNRHLQENPNVHEAQKTLYQTAYSLSRSYEKLAAANIQSASNSDPQKQGKGKVRKRRR